MLSIGAFNALLKTLEEPPEYVIFILATTEVHKIPITILSRCQRYDFHRITAATIKKQLSDLMEQEHVDTEDKALEYVARMADGSMRDALSLLDQCIAFYLGEKLTYDNVLEVLGTVDIQVYSDLLDMILSQDINGVMDLLEDVARQGREWSQFITDFLWYLRNLLLVGSRKCCRGGIGSITRSVEIAAGESTAGGRKHTDPLYQNLIRIVRAYTLCDIQESPCGS